MEAFSIGAVLVPTVPVALIVALGLAVWVAGLGAARMRLDPPGVRRVAEGAAWAGVLGARFGFVLANWSAFRVAPWTAVYLWQPGYLPYAGVLAGTAYALWRIARRPRSERWRRLRAVSAGFACGALALGALIGALHAFAPPTLLGRGDRMPDFRLVDLGGNIVHSSELAGRSLILNFWATWCPPCLREMPLLDEIHAGLAPEGLSILGISLEESPHTVLRYLAKTPVGYPLWVDPAPLPPGYQGSRALHERFGGAGLPLTVFVDRNGIVRDLHIGELNRGFLLERARALISR